MQYFVLAKPRFHRIRKPVRFVQSEDSSDHASDQSSGYFCRHNVMDQYV
jgi:hypothetical protein